jgi:hypothetical protein
MSWVARHVEEKYGPRWWGSKAARREVAIAYSRQRGPRIVNGIRTDRGMGIRFSPEIEPELARLLKRLPQQIQLKFQRRSMRQALTIWKRLAAPLYRRHRTKLMRKHLDESLFIVTRSYKSKRNGRNLWGALGFRVGRVRSIGGVAPPADRIYSNEWAGWRAHFLERGFTATGGLRDRAAEKSDAAQFHRLMRRQIIKTRVARGEGRRIPGKLYLPQVYAAGRNAAQAAFTHALADLIKTSGKRIRRLPRSIYAAEMRELLA